MKSNIHLISALFLTFVMLQPATVDSSYGHSPNRADYSSLLHNQPSTGHGDVPAASVYAAPEELGELGGRQIPGVGLFPNDLEQSRLLEKVMLAQQRPGQPRQQQQIQRQKQRQAQPRQQRQIQG
ncbi:hypothetical protein ACFL2Q_08345, partial [Thermodesulfobacteriota bacterium]